MAELATRWSPIQRTWGWRTSRCVKSSKAQWISTCRKSSSSSARRRAAGRSLRIGPRRTLRKATVRAEAARRLSCGRGPGRRWAGGIHVFAEQPVTLHGFDQSLEFAHRGLCLQYQAGEIFSLAAESVGDPRQIGAGNFKVPTRSLKVFECDLKVIHRVVGFDNDGFELVRN